MALEAPPELTPPTLASLKTFPMRGAQQPDGLGKLIQRHRQNGTPGNCRSGINGAGRGCPAVWPPPPPRFALARGRLP